jgi:flagellar motor switch protein FliN/FliY
VAQPGRDPLADVEVPAAFVSVAFAQGGGGVFAMPLSVARRIAASDAEELADAELGAVREAMGPVMEAAAAAAGTALGLELTVDQLDRGIARSTRDLKAGSHAAARVTVAVVTVFGEPCHLVGFVPSEFVARIGQDDEAAGHGDAVRDALGATLRDVPLRVWAEVGRARLRSAEVASLGDGAIVELDRAAEDPVDLYVNGSRIATGRLVCIDGKEWAVRLEEVFASAEADPAAA